MKYIQNLGSSEKMKVYRQKGDFIRLVCVRIAAALDQINKMADCRLYRLEGKQDKFLLLFSSNDCIIK